jgi:ATP-dependent Clp protease ATP-binding subunit ClpA
VRESGALSPPRTSIGHEHILLGLLREEEGLAARVLESLDITVERVRAQVVRIVGSGEEVTSGQIPFTPRAKKVLELALREALSLGHDFVGTEHILLGLVRDSDGVAARVLLDFDVDSEKVRQEVMRSDGAAFTDRSGYPGDQPPAKPSEVELGWRRRPIALAALGAAVLARSAFDPSSGTSGRWRCRCWPTWLWARAMPRSLRQASCLARCW